MAQKIYHTLPLPAGTTICLRLLLQTHAPLELLFAHKTFALAARAW